MLWSRRPSILAEKRLADAITILSSGTESGYLLEGDLELPIEGQPTRMLKPSPTRYRRRCVLRRVRGDASGWVLSRVPGVYVFWRMMLPVHAIGSPGRRVPGETMSDRIDPLERVSECERAMLTSTDPVETSALSRLRDLWLALIDQLPTLSEAQAAEETATIEKIHAATRGLGRTGIQ